MRGERERPDVSFDNIVHYILDDTRLDEDADDRIGSYVRDAKEAAYVHEAAKAILAMLKTYGGGLTDAQYTARPEWQHVLATAKAALVAVRAPDAERE